MRKNALVAASGFDRLEAFDIPVIVETGSLSWHQVGYWTPNALQGTCYGNGYPFHCTTDKSTSYLLAMDQSLKAASPSQRFTVRLQKSSTGFGRTSYNIIGGTLGDLLQTPFWENVRLKHKPWHVSL